MTKTETEKQTGPQVIGAGLPRTGTSSLQEALRILGFDPCHHMISDVLGNVNGCRPRWARVLHTTDKAERHAIVRDILKDYRAVVDFPASLMIDDMIEIYPNAKIILGLRSSPEAWRKSFVKTLELTMTPWWVACTFLWPSIRFLHYDAYPWWEKVNQQRYGARIYRNPNAADVYVRHSEFVRKIVPEGRLLEFSSEQGWEPLCEFLGVPVPDQPYPHALTADEIRREFFIGAAVGAIGWLVIDAVSGLAVWYLVGWALAGNGQVELCYRLSLSRDGEPA